MKIVNKFQFLLKQEQIYYRSSMEKKMKIKIENRKFYI